MKKQYFPPYTTTDTCTLLSLICTSGSSSTSYGGALHGSQDKPLVLDAPRRDARYF